MKFLIVEFLIEETVAPVESFLDTKVSIFKDKLNHTLDPSEVLVDLVVPTCRRSFFKTNGVVGAQEPPWRQLQKIFCSILFVHGLQDFAKQCGQTPSVRR